MINNQKGDDNMNEMLDVLNQNIEVLKSWSDLTKVLEETDNELVKEMVNHFELMKNDVIIMNQCLILSIYNNELALYYKEDKELSRSYIEKICHEMDICKEYSDNFTKHNEELINDLQLLFRYNYEGLDPKEWLKVKYIDNHYLELNSIYDVLVEEVLC